MTRTFKIWLVGFIATAAVVLVSVQWVDRPIAIWIFDLFGGRRIPTHLADRIVQIPTVTAIVFIVCGIIAIMGRRFRNSR